MPHQSVEESLDVIRNIFDGKECYAICEINSDEPIGLVELKLNGHTDKTQRDDECELGYWLGKPYWGRGYMPEAVTELINETKTSGFFVARMITGEALKTSDFDETHYEELVEKALTSGADFGVKAAAAGALRERK